MMLTGRNRDTSGSIGLGLHWGLACVETDRWSQAGNSEHVGRVDCDEGVLPAPRTSREGSPLFC